jgi:hypothetical protein
LLRDATKDAGRIAAAYTSSYGRPLRHSLGDGGGLLFVTSLSSGSSLETQAASFTGVVAPPERRVARV